MLDRTAALGIVISISLFAAYAIPELTSRDSSLNTKLSAGIQKVGEMAFLYPRVASAEEDGVPKDPQVEPVFLRPPRPDKPQDSRPRKGPAVKPGEPDPPDPGPEPEIGVPEVETPGGEAEEPGEPGEVPEDSAATPEEDLSPPAQREVSDRSGYSRVDAVSPPRTGIATYYHPSLEGGRMANGRSYRSWAMTAASNIYRLGAMLRVTHQDRSVEIEVTDRGAFSHALDLSSGAFKALAGSLAPGVIRVSIEEIW